MAVPLLYVVCLWSVGSSNLWVPSAECASSCSQKAKYDSGASETYQKVHAQLYIHTQREGIEACPISEGSCVYGRYMGGSR